MKKYMVENNIQAFVFNTSRKGFRSCEGSPLILVKIKYTSAY